MADDEALPMAQRTTVKVVGWCFVGGSAMTGNRGEIKHVQNIDGADGTPSFRYLVIR